MWTDKSALYFLCFIVIYLNLLQVSWAGYCQQSYQCPSTCYRQDRYKTKCGWGNLKRCTRYRQASYGCTKTCYRQICCQGFAGANCAFPVCYGVTTCPNAGKCVSPNNCQCARGFEKPKCADINECSTSNGGCQHRCYNTHGSFRCECRTGYLLASDTKSCIEINECNNNNGGCQQTCTNTAGSFKCGCNPGYSLNADSNTCSDIDECSAGTSKCAQVCRNTQGSYTCSCNGGYTLGLDKLTCEDIDECAADTDGCDHYCQNTIGSFTCSCRPGYALSNDAKTCAEIDECKTNNGNCAQTCTNSPGSYSCKCTTGYTLQPDKHSCLDIDECSGGLSGCEHNCVNTPGSYSCTCKHGYQLNKDGRTCSDIDDCVSIVCQNGGTCVDGIASHACHCTAGYTGNLCESDVDECSFLNGGCEDVCTNSFGSYRCSCAGNATLNTDGRSCSGGKDTGDVFERHKIARKFLPRGCSEIVLTKCTDGKEITIYLSSTAPWYRLKSNNQLVYTYGIVFAEVNSLSVPVSIPGVEVTMAEGDFNIKLGAGAYPDNAGDVVGSLRSDDCWQFDFTTRDIFEFVESSSFLKRYFYALIEFLPDWIKLQPTNDTVLDVQGLKTQLTYGRTTEEIDWCRGAPVLDDHLYSVFLFDTSISVSVYDNSLEIPKPLNQKKFCLIVDLCHNYGGTVFLIIPKESQHQFSEVDVFKTLYDKNKIQILPRGIGLSVVRGINVHKQTTSLTMWNGDHTFKYPVFERANLWIGGNFTKISASLVVQGSMDMFVSVPNPSRILTAMFLDEWNAAVTLRVNVTPIIKFKLFGDHYTLPFPHLVDIKSNIYMSVGGQKPRIMCGDKSNPPGFFLSTAIRINPFQDVPLLADWLIDNTNTIYAYFVTDPASQITDEFRIDIKNDILQIKNRVKRFKEFLKSTVTIFQNVLNNETSGVLSDIKDSVEKLEELTDKGIDSVSSFRDIIGVVTDMWKLYSKLDTYTDKFKAKVEFLGDVAKDNFTSLIEFEKEDLKNKVKAAVQKLRDQVSLAAKDYSGFGLKYTTSIRVFGFKFVGLDLEFVYSTSGIGYCSRFTKVYKLLEGQRSARFLGTYSEDVNFGYFLKAEAGMGVGGAFGIDNKRIILQVNAYVNMLGIKVTGDLFITEKGLYFFIEGNLWDIFLVHIVVSAERGDDWYKLLFKLEGRFLASARKRRQVQTADTSSFQASYLDALKKVITRISDETAKRIDQAKAALDDAKRGLSKAQDWLDEKKQELRKAHVAFDKAIAALERAKEKLEKAKAPFERALEKLKSAQRKVDRLCRIRECRKICIPGIKCRICRKKVGWARVPYPCCRKSRCMISFKDPICIAKNLICKGVRYIAYAALEAAKIFVRVPMIAFDVAKGALSATQFIVDKSRVVVDLAEGVFDLAKLGLEGAKGVLNVAKGALEAVKIVVGAAAKVLEFVIEYGVKNIIDVRNCGFSVELSTADLPVFDVSCEVNAFKLGWKKIRIRINFKNAFQTIWQAAKATIKSIMKEFRRVLGKRSINDITFRSTSQMHKLIRHIRETGPEKNLNGTIVDELFNETLDVVAEMDGFSSGTMNDYDNRVLLFQEKCLRIRNILNFFNDTFEVLHEIVNESVANFQEIDGLKDQLADFNSSNIAKNMTLEEAGVSEEYAMDDYNITREQLEEAMQAIKDSLMDDPMLMEISKSADFSKGILDSELKSVESLNIISQWSVAMENVTRDYFNDTECADFRDCIFYAVSILYDLYTYETLPDIGLTQDTISNIEDNILELFQNTTDNARGIYNTSAQLSENIKTLASMNLFCSEAPSFTNILANVTVIYGRTATLKCQVTADPTPNYWWYKNTVWIEMETSDTLVIFNVSKADEGSYRCVAGNVVANATSNDAHIIVRDKEDEKAEKAESAFNLTIFLVVTISGLVAVVLVILIVVTIVYHRRRSMLMFQPSRVEEDQDADRPADPPQVSVTQYENKLYGELHENAQGNIGDSTLGDIRGATPGDIRGATPGDIRDATPGDIRGATPGANTGATPGGTEESKLTDIDDTNTQDS